MGKINEVKILAEIGKLIAEIWGIYRDKNKSAEEQERRIKELEAQVNQLKEKIKT